MALKDLLFIKEDQPKKAVSETKTKFPDALPKSEDMKANLNKFPSCDPYIEDVIEIYDNGFNALNMSGYDFYEFYKAIVASGDTSPIVYKMAFNMGKSMDPSLTKEKLITQSDFYLGEIDKVHNQYEEDGLKKKTNLLESKSNDRSQLDSDIKSLEEQISSLQSKLESKKLDRNNIEDKWSVEISAMDCKILANDTAKNNLISSLNSVISGIKSNI